MSPTPLSARIHADLVRRAGAFEEALLRVGSVAGGEAVHDLRVSARRLSEGLRAWRAVLPASRPRVVRRVDRLRRALGGTRDSEVRFETLRNLVHDAPRTERPGALPLLRALAAQVTAARAAAARRARRRDAVRLPSRVHSLLAAAAPSPGPTPALDAKALARARAHARRCAVRLRAAERVLAGTRARSGAAVITRLHAVRVRAKRLRYAEECLLDAEALTGAEALRVGRALGRLRARQRRLGEACDLASLVAWLARASAARDAGSALERRAWLARAREAYARALRAARA